MTQQAKILTLLEQGPQTTAMIHAATGISRRQAAIICCELFRYGALTRKVVQAGAVGRPRFEYTLVPR